MTITLIEECVGDNGTETIYVSQDKKHRFKRLGIDQGYNWGYYKEGVLIDRAPYRTDLAESNDIKLQMID